MEPLQRGDPNPSVLGEYTLVGRLGEGAMGVVYLARSPGGRLVAIKMIRPELARDPEFRARFAREVAAVRKVSGLYTAAIIDAVLDGPVPYLVTAFIDGPTLAQSISDHGRLPVPTLRSLAAALAEGLRAIHALGIVHRDLKPGNVMLAADGPRLIDFGIVRALEGSSHTSTGAVLGTPSYMSPEQATGGEVGPPSDIFSLGALLAFAASGRPPFGEGAAVAILFRIATQPADISGVPAEVRPLIDRCLAKDPAQRPTAGDLLTELGEANAPDEPPKILADRPAGLGQDGQGAESAGPEPEEASGPEPIKSPADIARELRAAQPAGGNLGWPEHPATVKALQAKDKQRGHAGQAAEPVTGSPLAKLREQVRAATREENHRESRIEEHVRLIEGRARYEDLERIRTAPEFARRLALLAAEAAGEDVVPATWAASAWPAGVTTADIEAVQAGRLIPSRQLLDAYLVSLGVSPDHLQYWHEPLRRVRAATAGVINLRTRAIQLARDLDREHDAVRRRRSSNPLTRARARMEAQRADPNGIARASIYGQLYGEMVTLADRLCYRDALERLSDPYDGLLPHAPRWLSEALEEYEAYGGSDGEPSWLGSAVQGVKETIEVLAAVQVDASGVDLRNLSLPERDAVIGVVWTPSTKWPDGIMNIIREPRSRRIRPSTFQVI